MLVIIQGMKTLLQISFTFAPFASFFSFSVICSRLRLEFIHCWVSFSIMTDWSLSGELEKDELSVMIETL